MIFSVNWKVYFSDFTIFFYVEILFGRISLIIQRKYKVVHEHIRDKESKQYSEIPEICFVLWQYGLSFLGY